MKIKTINKLLTAKFNDFLKSITDPVVQDLVKRNTIITGGSIASMLLQEKVNDYDMYFTNKETVLAVAKYYVKLFNDANGSGIEVIDGAEYEKHLKEFGKEAAYKGITGIHLTPDRVKIAVKGVERLSAESDAEEMAEEALKVVDTDPSRPKYRPVALTCNAITLSDDVQLVIRFYGAPEDVHQTYDFVHATNYWLSHDGQLHINQPALESLITKELKYFGSKYPIASVIRTKKFTSRGWTCNAGQYLKMCFQIAELDLNDMDTLEDQLTGVDVAYFNLLITALRKKKEEDPNFNIGYEYITTIIDKIF